MASPTTPVRLPGDPLPPPPEPRYPWRVGLTMLGLVALVLVVVWLSFQALKGPPTAGQFPSPATATAIERNFEATVSAADTAQPRPTPRPTPQPSTQAPVVPTSAPTALAAPAVVPVATSQPAATTAQGSVNGTAAVTAAQTAPAAAASAPLQGSAQTSTSTTEAEPALTTTTGAGASGESTTPTPWPTVAPELVKDVSDAYTRYWQVVADTALSLDPTPLSDVAAGDQLTALQKSIEADRANSHATRMDILHNFVVISASTTQAEVADRLRYAATTVDASTQEPLPDQTQPTSADQAPETDAIVDLQQIDGVWKVVEAARAVAEERAP